MVGKTFSLGTFAASAILATLILAEPAAAASTIQVINNDGAGEGFNDPSSRAAVGGNNGSTLGQQRLIAFQFAANLWATRLTSGVTIKVRAQFDPLSCNSTSTILGSAGPVSVNRDFPNAPLPGTYFNAALADSLAGSDLSGGAGPDIDATFNSAIGTTCSFPNVWYYGLDGNPPGNQVDFVSVLIHELGHGLGFLTLVDLQTGEKLNGFNDAFMLKLENHGASPSDYSSMSNAQRVAASKSTGNLHWIGSNVRAASGTLNGGRVGDHVQMYAPAVQEDGSSVSHWDTALTPNQVMEPSYTQPLHDPVLEVAAFKDIGWNVVVSTSIISPHDFNGDAKSDILWRNTSGETGMWLMNGGALLSTPTLGVVPNNWSIVGQRDFNGDGKSDLLWLNSVGDIGIWFMNGGTLVSQGPLGNVGTTWKVVGTGDFNGDGKADILWRNTSGDLGIWFMNGGTLLSTAPLGNIPAIWSVQATGDFNGDGKADILWRNTSNDVGLWLMNGGTVLSTPSLGNVGAAWSIQGTGDFNGDGKADILWRSTSNDVGLWLMNGGTLLSTPSLGNVGATWNVTSVGDYNGDGKADILWRSTSHDIGIWFMNGGTLTSTAPLGNVGSAWLVQNAASN